MGKRTMTFEEKAARAARSKFDRCAKCGGDLVPTKVVRAYFSEKSRSYKFKEEMIKICQCNQKEIFS